MSRQKYIIKNLGTYTVDSIEEEFEKSKDKNKNNHYKKKSIIQKFLGNMKTHDSALEKIINAPEIINISNHFYSTQKELDFYEDRRHAGSADIIIETKDDTYAIEYKTNNTRNARRKAKKQLNAAKKFLGIDITKLLYVFGNNNVQELEKGQFKPFP